MDNVLYLLLKHFKFLFTAISLVQCPFTFSIDTVDAAAAAAAATCYPLNFQMPP